MLTSACRKWLIINKQTFYNFFTHRTGHHRGNSGNNGLSVGYLVKLSQHCKQKEQNHNKMSSWGDSVGYLIFGNPISQALLSTAASVIKSTEAILPRKLPATMSNISAAPPPPVRLPLWELAGGQYNFIRLAGLSGASAVIMGAYGKHIFAKFPNSEDKTEARTVFETANRFHFLHSFAFLAMPLVRKPLLTGSLMAVGTILFSAVLYYRALTGDRTYIPVATCGGFCLIMAWLTLIF